MRGIDERLVRKRGLEGVPGVLLLAGVRHDAAVEVVRMVAARVVRTVP